MTTGDYKKVFKQLKVCKPRLEKYIKHNAPKKRSCGVSNKKCARCGRIRGHVTKYGLNLCRQCFREISVRIGFKKYN